MALPPEIGGVIQPYSMIPLFRKLGHDLRYATPASSTAMYADRSEISIRTTLVAPTSVQRWAQAQGMTGMLMIRPRGIEKVNPSLRSTADMMMDAARAGGEDA